MSRISEVIKNKNKVEKAHRARRKNEMLNLRDKSAFKAKLHDELKHIEAILDSNEVDSVVIVIPEKFMYQFNSAIYAEDLAGYDIEQSNEAPNKFYIKRKIVRF